MVMIEIRDSKRNKLSELVDCIEKTAVQIRHCIEDSSQDEEKIYRGHRSGRYDEDDEDERDYGYDEGRYRMRGRSRY